jgi:replicative DNA helicase
VDPDAPAAFFGAEVINRRLHVRMREGMQECINHLESREPAKAYEHLEEFMFNLRKEKITGTRVESLPALMPEVIDYYERMEAGERGILMPWPTINDETLGLWPADLAVFVARTGIGKTWAALMIATKAWLDGHKVLFATTEMSKIRIAIRFAAIQFRLAYGRFRKGQLDAFEKKRFIAEAKKIVESEGLYIVGGDFDFRVESFESAIDEAEPDITIMDGAYLLKVGGRDRTERAANAFDAMKRIAKMKKIPMVVTHQFNRDVKANVASSVKLESMALSDVASWNADLIYALVQTEDMKRDKRMIFKSLKTREGLGVEIETDWDFEEMKFGEVEMNKDGGGGGDADEFGTGVDGDFGGGDDGVPF